MATIAGVAPFLGLFGTVTGLISAFRGIAATGSGGLATVSGGISEALVTTVIGLFVAIPALWAYNFFMNRIDVMGVERTLEMGKRPKAMPDITPIVNVALVLLIVFMVIMPMVREGIEVDTPQADHVEKLTENAENLVVLSIREDGALYVNLNAVDKFGLKQELALAYRGQEGNPIIIKGAKNLPYREILELMEICQAVGAPAVDLMAKKGG